MGRDWKCASCEAGVAYKRALNSSTVSCGVNGGGDGVGDVSKGRADAFFAAAARWISLISRSRARIRSFASET